MKFKCRIILAVMFSFMILLSCSVKDKNEIKNFKEVSLNKVIDGDVIKVSIDGKLENVKLLLTDAPKLKGKYPFSSEAKKFLENKLSSSQYIYLENSDDKIDRDINGRILAYVWYDCDGKLKMINEDIVNEGLARVSYSNDGGKYLENLILSQEDAKIKGKNIWSVEGYVSDSGFEK